MNTCPICREEHTPRPLSFDGCGVNSCGMYRDRLATFAHGAPRHLGPLFAAAPELADTLRDLCVAAGEANALQHAGLDVPPAVWSKMYLANNAARAVLAKIGGAA